MPKGKQVRLVCSDIDGTVLGDPEGVIEFRRFWEEMGDSRPLLVYSTGRLLEDAKRVIREGGLPVPDYFIGGVGTMIEEVRSGQSIDEYVEVLNEGWELERVEKLVTSIEGISPQPPEQQHAWKSSWFWYDASEEELERLRSDLRNEGVSAQVVYSSARDLDVLPVSANKGNALRWICDLLRVGLDEVIVCGDTGNDSSMFLVPGVRGIAVGNAEPELLAAIENTEAYVAESCCANGVIEGLKALGVIEEPNDSKS